MKIKKPKTLRSIRLSKMSVGKVMRLLSRKPRIIKGSPNKMLIDYAKSYSSRGPSLMYIKHKGKYLLYRGGGGNFSQTAAIGLASDIFKPTEYIEEKIHIAKIRDGKKIGWAIFSKPFDNKDVVGLADRLGRVRSLSDVL